MPDDAPVYRVAAHRCLAGRRPIREHEEESMLTRRTMLAMASGLCASMAHLKRSNAASPKPRSDVTFVVPRGACDTHVHVIGDPVEFPMAPDRDYTPPSATA